MSQRSKNPKPEMAKEKLWGIYTIRGQDVGTWVVYKRRNEGSER
jgi:hypothetical protein